MKKHLLLLAFAAAAVLPASAQSEQTVTLSSQSGEKENVTTAKTTGSLDEKFKPSKYIVGFTVGYVTKQIHETTSGIRMRSSLFLQDPGKMTHALRAGFSINPIFKYGLGFRTGVYMEYARELSRKNALLTQNNKYKYEMQDITMSVPVQFACRLGDDDFSVMLYTGPVFDFGVWERLDITEVASNKTVMNEDNYKSGNTYEGFNALWGVGAGIQYSRFRLDIGGEFGMVKKDNSYIAQVIEAASSDYTFSSYWSKPVYVTLTCFF